LREPAAVFVDYDGTITDADTFDVFVRHFAGDEKWSEMERKLRGGEVTLREALALETSFVRATLDEADALLRERAHVDPAFPAFVAACESRGDSLVVVSSGIEPLIRRALARAGLARLHVVANPVTILPEGWRLDFRDESDNGTDKAALVRAAQSAGRTAIYIGDGRSDFDAALAADRCFVKRGSIMFGDLSADLGGRNAC